MAVSKTAVGGPIPPAPALNSTKKACYDNCMKFILVVTDTHGKNLAFVSKERQTLSLKEAIEAVRHGDVAGAYVVERKTGSYIRTKASVPKLEQFEKLAIPFKNLLLYAQGAMNGTEPLSKYVEAYTASLQQGQIIIKPVGYASILAADIQNRLVSQRENIFDAARHLNIDPYLLGAIIIDESARLLPFEPIIDALGGSVAGKNVSVGIAQIKLDTANNLIKNGMYNPNPDDTALPFKRINDGARIYLFTYVIQPKHNIFFSAAFIRSLIDEWRESADLSKQPEIIATLYHQSHRNPHPDPAPDERGSQIAGEFYQLAKQWLQAP